MSEPIVSIDLYMVDSIDATTLAQLIEQTGPAVVSFIICEKIDEVRFFKSDQPLVLADWERGRLFNETQEVRWKRNGTGYRVALTIAAGVLVPATAWGAPQSHRWVVDERTIYLWGADDVRIGRKLSYDEVGVATGRAQIVVQTYLDPGNHRLRHHRYVRIQAESQEAAS
jgi:hypothetical protein